MKIENPEDFSAYFLRLMKLPANRAAYFASRAWQMRRQAVAMRSNGKCERCGYGKHEVTHHLTYAHFGQEYIAELQGICRPCHKYLHAKSAIDPCKEPPPAEQLTLFFENN